MDDQELKDKAEKLLKAELEANDNSVFSDLRIYKDGVLYKVKCRMDEKYGHFRYSIIRPEQSVASGVVSPVPVTPVAEGWDSSKKKSR